MGSFPLSVFAGCQIPYPKREFLTEEEPEDKADKVRKFFLLENIPKATAMPVVLSIYFLSCFHDKC